MTPDIAIRDDAANGRFIAELEGNIAWASYESHGDVLRFTATHVPDALAGRGVATQLARVALAEARGHRRLVEPACDLFVDYIRAHPETHDLLSPEGWRLLRR